MKGRSKKVCDGDGGRRVKVRTLVWILNGPTLVVACERITKKGVQLRDLREASDRGHFGV